MSEVSGYKMKHTENSSMYLIPRLVLCGETLLVVLIQSRLLTEAMYAHSAAASRETIHGLIVIPRSVWWPHSPHWYCY